MANDILAKSKESQYKKFIHIRLDYDKRIEEQGAYIEKLIT